MIVKLWYESIVSGDRNFNQVPRMLKDKVKAMLLENGYENLIK